MMIDGMFDSPAAMTLAHMGRHRYTLAATGTPFRAMTFCSRPAAEEAMYEAIGRRGLSIREVYDDRHDKTYVCDGGARFYITRW